MKAWVRRHPLAALIIPALVMLLVGLVAGQFVKSPAQVAADAAPPEQTTLTAPVEKGKVQRTESADAQIKPTAPEVVAPAPPGGGAEKAVVSAIHVSVGGKVEAGTSLVDVAGRPYVVCSGEPEGQAYARIGGSGVAYAGSMTYHVFESLGLNAGLCIHLRLLAGRDPHHIVEAEYKALARALRDAVALDPRVVGAPSTKGAL